MKAATDESAMKIIEQLPGFISLHNQEVRRFGNNGHSAEGRRAARAMSTLSAYLKLTSGNGDELPEVRSTLFLRDGEEGGRSGRAKQATRLAVKILLSIPTSPMVTHGGAGDHIFGKTHGG